MFRKVLAAATALALTIPFSAQAQQRMDITINVGTRDQNGICAVFLPGEGDLELEVSARGEDGNVNVAVHNIPSDWVVDDADPAIRLTTQGGKSYNSEGGAYRAGFTYRVMSFYDTQADGMAVLSALKGNDSFSASFDGHNAGSFNIQAHSDILTDYAYEWMKTCIEGYGGPTNF